MYSMTGNPYFKPCLTKETKSFKMNLFDETVGYFLLFLNFPDDKNLFQLHKV